MKHEPPNTSTKVRADHLDRKAYVYVRQSTLHQVENHLESQRRQYAFAEQAVALGWPCERVVVVDEDQGKSGSCPNNRSGFARLVTAVGLGEVGIVMSLEASRLARNSPDWHNLIYMSRYTGTLIADEYGIYDPGSVTDRMVLGFRGQMSELELDTSIHRMMAGRMNKAERGEFLVYPPAGYDIDDLDQLVISNDEAVRDAVRAVFVKFDELGSAKRVCVWWRDQGLKFPVRRVELRSHPIVWMEPVYRMFLYVLHHPIYAGAYVFGRSKRVRDLDPMDSRKLRIRQLRVPREEWPVLLQDHHEPYIAWAQFELNQERLRDNVQMRRSEEEGGKGPVREGWALLQGLLRCGRCGRSMYLGYGGSRPSSATRTLQYRCSVARQTYGGSNCQIVGGKQIDNVVAEVFLAATAQASSEAARLALQELEEEEVASETMWRHQIEQAEYEGQRAQRQYNAVEPENRLVARTLETQWNVALQRVEELKSEAESKRHPLHPLSEHEKARAGRLAEDLTAVWSMSSTTNQDRKQLLRAAIDEVQLRTEDEHYAVKIVWKGGAIAQRLVKRRKRGDLPATATPKDTVEMVRTLAAEFDDAQIARVLNKQGRRTGHGNPFTAHKVAQLRNRNGIAVHPVERASDPKEGPFTADEAAAQLGVCSSTVLRWLREGILPGQQLAPAAPWKIVLTEELRKKLTASDAPVGWVGLTEAAKQLGLPKQQVAYLVKRGKLTATRVKFGTRQYWKIDVSSASCGTQSKLF
jgi:DNA invertase Pin-like site-specific DNA recombinase/uncharacterized protein YndB with AHSA1/START domain